MNTREVETRDCGQGVEILHPPWLAGCLTTADEKNRPEYG